MAATKQHYRCQVCGRQFVADPASRAHSPTLRRCVLAALNERMSLRGAERVFKVSRQTIARWLEEAAAEVEDEFMRVLPLSNTLLTLEMDEVWSFIGQKKKQFWLWVALDRATRRVVAWVCGDRSAHNRLAIMGSVARDLPGSQSQLHRFLVSLLRHYTRRAPQCLWERQRGNQPH